MAVSSESEIEMVPSGLSAVTSQHALDGKGERHVQQSGRKSLAITIVEPHTPPPTPRPLASLAPRKWGSRGCNSWRQLGRLCSMLGRVLKSAAKLRTHAVMRTGLLVGEDWRDCCRMENRPRDPGSRQSRRHKAQLP